MQKAFLEDIKKRQKDETNEDEPIGIMQSFGTQSKNKPTSFDTTDNMNTHNSASTEENKRKKKKKKKKKEELVENNQFDNEFKEENKNNKNDENDDNDDNDDDHKIVNNNNKNEFSRQKTQISILKNAIPDTEEILGFHKYPSLLKFTFIFAFLASIDIMINLPTLYATCQDTTSEKYFYMYVLGVYMTAQFISALFIGFWMDRRPISEILIILSLSLAAGNMLYTHGVAKHQSSLLLIGRTICGVASSIFVVGYAHVTRYSDVENREKRIIFFSFVTAMGAIIGPLLGVVVSRGSLHIIFWEISQNNAGSFVVFCLSSIYMVSLLMSCLVTPKKDISRMRSASRNSQDLVDDLQVSYNYSMSSFQWSTDRFCSPNAVVLLLLYSIAVFSFWSFEGAIIPIGQTNDDWTVGMLYAIFVLIGIIYVFGFLLNEWLGRWFKIHEEKRVIFSLLFMSIGSVFLTSLGINKNQDHLPTWQVLLATIPLTIGFCIATIQIPVLYCVLVGAQVGDLGVRMSWFFAFASFGRILGPVYGFLIIHNFHSVNFVAHTSTLLTLIGCVIAFGSIKMNNNERTRIQSNDNIHTQFLNDQL